MTDEAARRLLEQRREDLFRRRAALEAQDADGLQQDLSGVALSDQHPADAGTETFEREKDLSILNGIDAELQEIDHALVRIGNGGYGVCEACGSAIQPARLQALPAVRLCVEDQAKLERGARADV